MKRKNSKNHAISSCTPLSSFSLIFYFSSSIALSFHSSLILSLLPSSSFFSLSFCLCLYLSAPPPQFVSVSCVLPCKVSGPTPLSLLLACCTLYGSSKWILFSISLHVMISLYSKRQLTKTTEHKTKAKLLFIKWLAVFHKFTQEIIITYVCCLRSSSYYWNWHH